MTKVNHIWQHPAFGKRFILPLFCLLLAACSNDPKDIKLLTSGSLHEDKAIGITGIYSKNGGIKGRLFADEYVKHTLEKRPYSELNRNLRIEFYNDSGQIEHTLTADSCRIYEADGNAIVWGNVKILSIKGEQLFTEELIWNQKLGRFYTEKQVRIITGNEMLDGNGLEANQDFTWYRIVHPSGSVQVEKGDVPQ